MVRSLRSEALARELDGGRHCCEPVQPLEYLDEITGGSPYGATTITGGDGSRLPTANELQRADFIMNAQQHAELHGTGRQAYRKYLDSASPPHLATVFEPRFDALLLRR
jgi:hypothetical protein